MVNKVLPDFITMTNSVERKGLKIRFNSSEKGVTGDLYKGENLINKGVRYYSNCLEAQKEIYTKLFVFITKDL